MALVQLTEDQDAPVTVQPHAVKLGYLPGPVAINYPREHILCRDLPSLHPTNMLPASSDPSLVDVDVVSGMRDVVAEARTERNERSDNGEESQRPKTVREKMVDTIMYGILLLCRATCNEELPHIYQEWAARTMGVSERWVM
jgi:hypothetical protein